VPGPRPVASTACAYNAALAKRQNLSPGPRPGAPGGDEELTPSSPFRDPTLGWALTRELRNWEEEIESASPRRFDAHATWKESRRSPHRRPG
jgi:hypothetical protein